MKGIKEFKILLLTYFLFSNVGVFSQTGNYWSDNFGSQSVLLNGVVTGSVEDLGAVYYNPARIVFSKKTALTISTKAYEINNSFINEPGVGKLRVRNGSTGASPNLVAGLFKIKGLKNHTFAYSFLLRQKSDFDIFNRRETKVDNDLYVEKRVFSKLAKERWYGLSWSHSISKKLSVGASVFFSSRSQSNALGYQIISLEDSTNVALLERNNNYSYSNYALIPKLGVAFQNNSLALGLTVTIPRINVSGDGDIFYENIITDDFGSITDQDLFEYIVKNDSKSKVHSPLSIGAGAGIFLDKSKIHVSMEYFAPIKKYSVLETVHFEGQTSKNNIAVRYQERARSIVNFGIGYEYKFNDKLTAYGSFSTDYSAQTSGDSVMINDENTPVSFYKSNLYKIGGGFDYNPKWGDISFGVNYAFSNQNILDPFSLPSGSNLTLPGSANTSSIEFRQRRVQFFVGVTFPFIKEILKNQIFFEN
ncbi:outer membrane protein transport protein [Aureivirga sp. CE67]|uniref:outer membrane protein transport protein n=1 Tax=Aureivirga sp. CE67 TaxID=1788983 RepID=UPI0018CA8809|nr:outer membrane protein transport protein [Aureivirga sp. CE67]